MKMTKKQRFDMAEQAWKCVMQFVQDAGYEDCHQTIGQTRGRHEPGELLYDFHFEARKGPRATRKTPIEHLVVRVRCTGPNHKTLRPSFVASPPDSAKYFK